MMEACLVTIYIHYHMNKIDLPLVTCSLSHSILVSQGFYYNSHIDQSIRVGLNPRYMLLLDTCSLCDHVLASQGSIVSPKFISPLW